MSQPKLLSLWEWRKNMISMTPGFLTYGNEYLGKVKTYRNNSSFFHSFPLSGVNLEEVHRRLYFFPHCSDLMDGFGRAHVSFDCQPLGNYAKMKKLERKRVARNLDLLTGIVNILLKRVEAWFVSNLKQKGPYFASLFVPSGLVLRTSSCGETTLWQSSPVPLEWTLAQCNAYLWGQMGGIF